MPWLGVPTEIPRSYPLTRFQFYLGLADALSCRAEATDDHLQELARAFGYDVLNLSVLAGRLLWYEGITPETWRSHDLIAVGVDTEAYYVMLQCACDIMADVVATLDARNDPSERMVNNPDSRSVATVPISSTNASNLVRELQLHDPIESAACKQPGAQLGQAGAQPSPRPLSPAQPSLDPLLTVEQAAAYLGMSAKWVYRNYRRLTPILIGDGPRPRIRFRRSDLDAWIVRHRIQ